MTTQIGSLYSRIGGLDWAVEQAFDARTAWQLDLVGAAVRRRHWPEALQVEADVSTVDPLDMPHVDILCGGFACQDLSVAGRQSGLLDGARTGLTYRHLVRFASALRPDVVVMENVPALLTKWREALENDWERMGYGLTWVRARALDAGRPHIRRRVFVLARRGEAHRGVIDAPTGGAWTPEQDARTWATPRASDDHSPGGRPEGRESRDGVAVQVRAWPTTTATDARSSGAEAYSTTSGRHSGTTLTDAFQGKRLNPDWVEALMGLPPGWTCPTGGGLSIDPQAPAVRGRYPAGWDRTQHWPGYDWEPPRALPDGPPLRGRPARISGVGNAVCPQQGLLALRAGLATECP